jgi:hypothetical protein
VGAARQALTAVDGRLVPARPTMAWTVWQDAPPRAAKRHVACAGLRQLPVGVPVTAAHAAARADWRRLVPPGGGYGVDRGDAADARLQARPDLPCHVLARGQHNAADAGPEECPRSAAGQAAGVRRDGLLRRLGPAPHPRLRPQPCRVVRVASGQTTAAGPPALLGLVTKPLELEAEPRAVASRWRWAVALLVRCWPGGVGCRHRLRQRANGVRLQVSGALIARLRISLWVGRPPPTRTSARLGLYRSAGASAAEVSAQPERWPFHVSPPGKP